MTVYEFLDPLFMKAAVPKFNLIWVAAPTPEIAEDWAKSNGWLLAGEAFEGANTEGCTDDEFEMLGVEIILRPPLYDDEEF